jgi:high-affinity nickel permease
MMRESGLITTLISEHLIITIAVIILVVIQTLLNNKESIKHKATKISSKINEDKIS